MKTFQSDLESRGGFWQYKEGAKYLALLASGKISDTFVNCGLITTFPYLLEEWATILSREIRAAMPSGERELYIVGTGMGGITLAYEVARMIDAKAHALFTEPVEAGGTKMQKFRFEIPVGASVILIEDVITTGGSVQKTLDAVCEKGFVDVLPIIGCLVDRRECKKSLLLQQPNSTKINLGANVVSLLSISPRTWDTLADAQKDCPSVVEAIKPKANWQQLVNG